jgi:hypothetical protein
MTPFQQLLGSGTTWLCVAAFLLFSFGHTAGHAVGATIFLGLGMLKYFVEHA